ncbi:MAG: hypothetical protein HOE80_02405 [Candidatus Magasanikbacteria bacterium]|jgi:hypothetical protein|nr:hypothetical protein [Candidatus Magasanikbacteria bacterium]MBT4071552.1 hypothetical protein [Candidatus Magasanikbacteria bacterium]
MDTRFNTHFSGGLVTIPAKTRQNIPLPFQPMGIAVQYTEDGDQIAIADYFGSRIMLIKTSLQNDMLVLETTFISGASGAQYRLFPDFDQTKARNGLDGVGFKGNDILYTRNSHPKIHVISPRDNGNWQYNHVAHPSMTTQNKDHCLFSWQIEKDYLYTLEGSRSKKEMQVMSYHSTKGKALIAHVPANVGTLHGLWINHQQKVYLLHRGNSTNCGILSLSDNQSIMQQKDVWGSGFCKLSNGALIITKYGPDMNGPWGGNPGALLYIPANQVHF